MKKQHCIVAHVLMSTPCPRRCTTGTREAGRARDATPLTTRWVADCRSGPHNYRACSPLCRFTLNFLISTAFPIVYDICTTFSWKNIMKKHAWEPKLPQYDEKGQGSCDTDQKGRTSAQARAHRPRPGIKSVNQTLNHIANRLTQHSVRMRREATMVIAFHKNAS